MPKVYFQRSGVEAEVPTGSNLRQVALKHNVQLYAGPHKVLNCHGLSQCGACRVLLRDGTEKNAGPKTFLEKTRLAMAFFNIGHGEEMRLACQVKINGDMTVMERPPSNMSGTYGPEAERAVKRLNQGKF